jgi:hypothetical protein
LSTTGSRASSLPDSSGVTTMAPTVLISQVITAASERWCCVAWGQCNTCMAVGSLNRPWR